MPVKTNHVAIIVAATTANKARTNRCGLFLTGCKSYAQQPQSLISRPPPASASGEVEATPTAASSSEPTDEIVAILMDKVADEVRDSNKVSDEVFFDNLRKEAISRRKAKRIRYQH